MQFSKNKLKHQVEIFIVIKTATLCFNLMEVSGLEPLTPCVQSRCSPS